MKLTNTHSMKRKSGMTLLELTVVILVLLSLITILFVGARAWKKGSDRAGCILNMRNMQQAVRAQQNMYGVAEGANVAYADVIGSGKYIETNPICPGAGTYSVVAGGNFVVPVVSTICVTCTLAATEKHVPSTTVGW